GGRRGGRRRRDGRGRRAASVVVVPAARGDDEGTGSHHGYQRSPTPTRHAVRAQSHGPSLMSTPTGRRSSAHATRRRSPPLAARTSIGPLVKVTPARLGARRHLFRRVERCTSQPLAEATDGAEGR